MTNLSKLQSFQALQAHYQTLSGTHLSTLFEADVQNRFEDFSEQAGSLFVDYSKNHITQKTRDLLINLATECGLAKKIEAMFTGEMVNSSEQRPALHTALRNRSNIDVYCEGNAVMPLINQTLARLKTTCQQLTDGSIRSSSEALFTDVVNIGIGGSDLGPRLACDALHPFATDRIRTHFVSNIDGTDLAETLKQLNPNTTLFIISSKSFATKETLRNAKTARLWLENRCESKGHLYRHFFAITAEKEKALAFGIPEPQIFPLWPWVGGRYSVWSAIGLPLILQIGFEGFEAFLSGAHAMDKHFRHTPFNANVPVLLGLIDVWYRNFFKTSTQAIIPYNEYLRHLPSYLQQLMMESNGKQVTTDGTPVHYKTGAIIWGMLGSNSEHAIHQYLFQGTTFCPVDFILAQHTHNPLPEHHQRLYSACLAQSRALVYGRTQTEAEKLLLKQRHSTNTAAALAPHYVIPGNRPSNTILFEKLTPYTLGALLALYEHRTFVQSAIWQINPFDQFGVELGKEIGQEIFDALEKETLTESFDTSTQGLISLYKKVKSTSKTF